jgi:hypothetical protein
MKKFNVREFTETDWYMLGGAERFNDTHGPLVFDEFKYTDDTICIADKNGIQLIVDDDEYHLRIKSCPWSYYVARNFIQVFLRSIENLTEKEMKLYVEILNFEKVRVK